VLTLQVLFAIGEYKARILMLSIHAFSKAIEQAHQQMLEGNQRMDELDNGHDLLGRQQEQITLMARCNMARQRVHSTIAVSGVYMAQVCLTCTSSA
jgi:hypothetical protein